MDVRFVTTKEAMRPVFIAALITDTQTWGSNEKWLTRLEHHNIKRSHPAIVLKIFLHCEPLSPSNALFTTSTIWQLRLSFFLNLLIKWDVMLEEFEKNTPPVISLQAETFAIPPYGLLSLSHVFQLHAII